MIHLCNCSGSLASTLELSRKRKQPTKASCETCGGRRLVDGIEPVPASMLSAVDLELTKFINPDLTWKTVTKGYRSMTRRTRKPAAKILKVGVELGHKSPKKVEDSSVFESEKLGVAVLGRRFAEKVEHVPIKKRRLLLRSPSPPPRTPSPNREESLSPQPQTPSPHPEESEQLVDRKCASGRWCCPQSPDSFSNRQIWASDGSIAVNFGNGVNGVLNGKISEVRNGELGCPEDFSGIALLAAAACSSSMDDDADNVKNASVVEESATSEGIDSSTAAKLLKETIAPSETGNDFQKDLAHEDSLDGSFVLENSGTVLEDFHNNKNVGSLKRPAPLKDDRLHWDLNTVMDTWDQPCDDPLFDSQRHDSQCVLDGGMQSEKLNSKGCEIQTDFEDAQHDIESKVQSVACRMVSSKVHGNQMLLDSKGTILGSSKCNIEEHKLEVCSGPERNCIKTNCVSTPAEHVLELLNDAVADTKVSTPVISMDASLDNSCCPGSHHLASTCVFEIKINEACGSIVDMQKGEDCCRTASIQLGKSSVNKGHPDVASTDMPVPENAVCEIDSIQSKDGEVLQITSGLPDSWTNPREVVSTLTCKALDGGDSVSKLDKVDPFHPSPKCDEYASSTSIGEGHPVVIGDAKGLDDKASAAETTINDSSVHIEPKDLMPKCYGHLVSTKGAEGGFISKESCRSYGDDPTSCTGKLASEDSFNNCYGLDISRDERAHIVGVENMTELQAGYDSPFEDGELRESGVYPWEENEVEDGETECVDYESDGDGDDFYAVDYSLSGKIEGCEGSVAKKDDTERIGKKALDAGSGNAVKGDALKEPSHSASLKTKTSGCDQLQEHLEDVIADGNDVGKRKTHPENMDALDDKGLLADEVGSRVSRGKLSSHIEGSASFDVLHSRSDNPRDSRCFGSDKSMGRGRFSFQVHGRNEMDGHWVDSSVGYWDSRNRYPSSYRGSEGHSYSRPRNAIANSAAKVDGLNRHDNRQSINYSSKGIYRPAIRRRSPVDRDDSLGVRRGTPPVRGISHDRSRGRSIYPQGFRRGPKEECHEPLPDDDAASSVRMPHYLAKRERGFSPNFNRGDHFSRPRRKSRSRSRTRSPLAWHLQRERNAGTRRQSPVFRSEARIEGMRLPFKKPSFAADYDGGFMSPPRGRLSPKRNSRWFDDQNCMDDHFRDRRSPVRMFRRSQRFDSAGFSGRLKSDDYFRPMIRPGRFSQIAGAGRGRKFEDSDDDRRKPDDRYGMIHRVRRYDAGGVVRRFRYDAEDCFEAHNSHNEDDCFRGTTRRDVPRSIREDRGPSRYNSDRMYTAASSTGLRDYDQDASPRGE